jgi:mRNA interferase RelE/StbE
LTASYSDLIKKSAEHELRAISQPELGRLAARIQGLATRPRPPGCEKPSGEDRYRIRQGDYPVVYGIDDNRRTVHRTPPGSLPSVSLMSPNRIGTGGIPLVSVVVFPAPLAPSSVVIPSSRTWSDATEHQDDRALDALDVLQRQHGLRERKALCGAPGQPPSADRRPRTGTFRSDRSARSSSTGIGSRPAELSKKRYPIFLPLRPPSWSLAYLIDAAACDQYEAAIGKRYG